MSFDYIDLSAMAAELIAEAGQAGAIRRQLATGAAHDPTLTPVDFPATLAVLEYADSKIDGTLIQKGDRLAYISTEGLSEFGAFDDGFDDGFVSSFAPLESDQLGVYGSFFGETFIGQFFQVVRLKTLNPAGTPIFYEAQVRS